MRIQKILIVNIMTILSGGQTKGRIQSNGTGKTKAKEVKEETKKVKEEAKKVERIVPIVLSGREEGRSRSREKVSNPFLSGSNGSSNGFKAKLEKEKVSNGNSTSPTKIAPLATEEVF